MSKEDIFSDSFPESVRMSWEEVEGLVWDVFTAIRHSDYDPDVIVGVARGGLVPARILVDYLQKKYICTLQMGHWNGDTRLSDKPSLIYPLPEMNFLDKKVLVVDDISDEGQTMEEVRAYLEPRVLDIKTCVLVSKHDSRFTADFCPRVLYDDWRWILFPWSMHEDLVVFTEKVLQLTGGVVIEDIIRILEDAMNMEIATREIEKVLVDMELSKEVRQTKDKVWTLI
jgi:hypoxanthine phosphoribosyltransferase